MIEQQCYDEDEPPQHYLVDLAEQGSEIIHRAKIGLDLPALVGRARSGILPNQLLAQITPEQQAEWKQWTYDDWAMEPFDTAGWPASSRYRPRDHCGRCSNLPVAL